MARASWKDSKDEDGNSIWNQTLLLNPTETEEDEERLTNELSDEDFDEEEEDLDKLENEEDESEDQEYSYFDEEEYEDFDEEE